jgi:hypothetical protein
MSAGPQSQNTTTIDPSTRCGTSGVLDDAQALQLTEEEREETRRLVWNTPAEMGSPLGHELPPSASEGIRIECVSRRPLETLAGRLELCRTRQREKGRLLASTFCHGGSLFLVFKHWPGPPCDFP